MNQITAAKFIDILQKQVQDHNLSLDELKIDFRFNHRNDWAFNMEELYFDYCGGSLIIDIEPQDTGDYLPDNDY